MCAAKALSCTVAYVFPIFHVRQGGGDWTGIYEKGEKNCNSNGWAGNREINIKNRETVRLV